MNRRLTTVSVGNTHYSNIKFLQAMIGVTFFLSLQRSLTASHPELWTIFSTISNLHTFRSPIQSLPCILSPCQNSPRLFGLVQNICNRCTWARYGACFGIAR